MSALRHRTARFLVVVALLWIGWETYLVVSAKSRLGPEIARDLERGGLLSITVGLRFAPEDFHIRIFQSHGIVSGVSGTSVRLRRVTPDDVRRIARYYWVDHIEVSPGP